jgi:hypothetical protein
MDNQLVAEILQTFKETEVALSTAVEMITKLEADLGELSNGSLLVMRKHLSMQGELDETLYRLVSSADEKVVDYRMQLRPLTVQLGKQRDRLSDIQKEVSERLQRGEGDNNDEPKASLLSRIQRRR